MIVTDLRGRVEFLNAAAERLTGFQGSTSEQRRLQDVLQIRESHGHPAGDDLVNLAIMKDGPLALGKDLAIVTASGETRQIEGEISVRLSAGVPTGTVVTLRDITARNWEERRTHEEQKLSAVSRLAGAVVHELKNLLAVVQEHSESLQNTYPHLVPLQDSTAGIRQAMTAVTTMTRQLQTLSGAEALRPKVVELNSLVERLPAVLKSILPVRVEVRLALEPAIGRIFADPAQIEQAITHLAQYCGGRIQKVGTLTISTARVVMEPGLWPRHLRRYVRLTMEDSGCSLRAQAVDEFLEPAWDANPSRPNGLGLFTVFNAIAAANGHFSIESESPSGAKFVMLFPEMEAGVFSPDAEARPATLPMAGTILFVENNDAIRLLVRNAFEKRGYRVIEARDGNEAILQSRLHTEAIDLLISDIAMPAMDGPTLARKLGALHPEMRVILISSRPIDPSAVSELAGTNTRFVRKPFTQRDLLTQAEGLLNGNQKSARN